MKLLPLPKESLKEDSVLLSVCKKNAWNNYQMAWQEAYNSYRSLAGNPWKVFPASALTAIQSEQRALYDTRASGGPIRRIRGTKGLVCCPMCGSPTTGSIDHYLPRAVFPEFSILYSNLVPACMHCNSATKGDTYRGLKSERFIHPYYDSFAEEPLWQVSIVPPYEAARFVATPMAQMESERAEIIAFHLKHVLGDQFKEWMRTQWGRYPEILAKRRGGATTPLLPENVLLHLEKDTAEAEITDGINGWRTALYRGLRVDQGAATYLAKKASAIQPG